MLHLFLRALKECSNFFRNFGLSLDTDEVYEQIPTTWVNTIHGPHSLRGRLQAVYPDITDAEVLIHVSRLEALGKIELEVHDVISPRNGQTYLHQQCRKRLGGSGAYAMTNPQLI